MRFFAFPVLAPALVLLAACAGTVTAPAQVFPPPVVAPTPAPAPSAVAAIVARADTVVLSGERGFAAAELAYITAADGVGRLVDRELIQGATAERVRGWNARARRLIVLGGAARDAAEKARLATQLFGLADSLDAVRKGR